MLPVPLPEKLCVASASQFWRVTVVVEVVVVEVVVVCVGVLVGFEEEQEEGGVTVGVAVMVMVVTAGVTWRREQRKEIPGGPKGTRAAGTGWLTRRWMWAHGRPKIQSGAGLGADRLPTRMMVEMMLVAVTVLHQQQSQSEAPRRSSEEGDKHNGGNGRGYNRLLRDPEEGAAESGRFGTEDFELRESFGVVDEGCAVRNTGERGKEEEDAGKVHNNR